MLLLILLWILLRILWILWIHGFCFWFLLVKDAGTTETVGPSMAEVGFLSLVEKVAAHTTVGREVCYLLGGLSSVTAAVLSTAEEGMVTRASLGQVLDSRSWSCLQGRGTGSVSRWWRSSARGPLSLESER